MIKTTFLNEKVAHHIENLVRELTSELGTSPLTGNAYDTAWVANLKKVDSEGCPLPLYPQELERLVNMQNDDGSWGESRIHHHCDRLVNTLAATIVLQRWVLLDPAEFGEENCDFVTLIEKGLSYLWRESLYIYYEHHELGGFELLVPALVEMAEKVNLLIPKHYYAQLEEQRKAKLAMMNNNPKMAYSKFNTLAYELEIMGSSVDPNLLPLAQEANGSVFTSPSATAFLLDVLPGNLPARNYIDRMLEACHQNGPPCFWPIEIYDVSFSLYHFITSGLLTEQPNLIFQLASQQAILHDGLKPNGCLSTRELSPSDGEDTANAIYCLCAMGELPDINILKSFEEEYGIRCFERERNPSVTTNARSLLALSYYCEDPDFDRLTTKIIGFIASQQQQGYYWTDKWQSSPYYATEVVMQALSLPFYQNATTVPLVESALKWIKNTQGASGGWGFYDIETVEETACAVKALLLDKSHCLANQKIAERGIEFIIKKLSSETTSQWAVPLWIGKVLYAPLNVVKATALGALYAYYKRYEGVS